MNKKVLVFLLAFFIIFSTTACGWKKDSRTEPLNPSVDLSSYKKIDYKTLNFTGPYAPLLRNIAKEYKNNNFILNAIKDQKITTEEFLVAYKLEQQCLAKYELEIKYESPSFWDGGYSITDYGSGGKVNSDGVNKAVSKCSNSSGMGSLYSYMQNLHSNPNNEKDTINLLIKCFINHNLVPKDYTRADYDRESAEIAKGSPGPNNYFDKISGSNATKEDLEQFSKCSNNPTDLP